MLLTCGLQGLEVVLITERAPATRQRLPEQHADRVHVRTGIDGLAQALLG